MHAQRVCLFILALIASLGSAALVRVPPEGVIRIQCHDLPALDDESIALYASQFVAYRNGDFDGVALTREPYLTCADTFINVTYTQLSVEPRYNETIALQLVDLEAPILNNIPTQPAQIPLTLTCLHEVQHLAGSSVWERYIQHIYARDRCQPKVKPQYSYRVTFGGGCRNRGQLELSFSADDGCGNTAGSSLTIAFNDYVAPTLRKFAIDNYKKFNAHARYCVHGAAKRAMCPPTLFRNIFKKIAQDDCDTEEVHLSMRLVRVYQKKRGQTTNMWSDVADGGSELMPHKTYASGTLLRAVAHISDSCGNNFGGDVISEVYFADTETACHDMGWFSLPASDYASTTAATCY